MYVTAFQKINCDKYKVTILYNMQVFQFKDLRCSKYCCGAWHI